MSESLSSSGSKSARYHPDSEGMSPTVGSAADTAFGQAPAYMENRDPMSMATTRLRFPGILSKDLASSCLFAALFALSPLSSSNRLVVSIVVGIAAGIAFHAYRWWLRRRAGPEGEKAGTFRITLGPIHWTLIVLFGAVSAPTIRELYVWYTDSVWQNGHGLFLPWLIAIVAWEKMRHLRERPISHSGWGIAVLIAGAASLWVSSGFPWSSPTIFSLLLMLVGLLLVLIGPEWTSGLWVPIAMVAFFLPLSPSWGITLDLPQTSATVARWILDLVGPPIQQTGSQLAINVNLIYAITDRCGGFAIAYGGVVLSIALATMARSWRRGLLLVACTIPLVCLANGARVAGLVLYCESRGISPNATLLHGVSGIAAYLGTMFALMILAGSEARRKLFLR